MQLELLRPMGFAEHHPGNQSLHGYTAKKGLGVLPWHDPFLLLSVVADHERTTAYQFP